MKQMIKKVLILVLISLTLILHMSNADILKINAHYINFDFSDITEEESLAFIAEHKIDIPQRIKNSSNLGKITKDIIIESVNNPYYEFSYSYDKMLTYAESIQELVVLYNNERTITQLADHSYVLQHSTVEDANGNWVSENGKWNERWYTFNCYAYAINRTEETNFYMSNKKYQPGELCGNGSFDTINSIYDLALLVQSDLQAVGYSNVYISNEVPSVTNMQDLICVRMCEEDFHFMKYDLQTLSWYHKPGFNAIMKYNYTPNNDIIWNNEFSRYGVEHPGSVVYDSDIYFIRYDKIKIDINPNMNSVSHNFAIQQGKDYILEINSTLNSGFHFSISSQYNLDIEIYNNEMLSTTLYDNINSDYYISFVDSKYYIQFSFQNSDVSGSVNLNVLFSNHKYTYQWKDYQKHYALCACGISTLQAHAISYNDYALGKNYATCILCGGLAETGFIQMSLNMNKTNLVTKNGSFILQNGVIVLNDKDYDEFLKGTLVFDTENTRYID